MGTIVNFPGSEATPAVAAMPRLERVMHVDDDDDIRVIAKMTLELVGQFEVTQFSSGAEAIAGAQACNPQLVLLDMMMPDMNGQETWQQLSRLPGFEDVPVVFMTAKAERQFTQTMLEEGARAVITKPFDPQQLCAQINDVWAKIHGQG